MGEVVPTLKKLGLANKIEDQRINTTCAWESNKIQTNRVRGIIISLRRSSQIQTTRDPFEDALQIIYAPAARHAVGHQKVDCTSFQIASHYPSLEDFGVLMVISCNVRCRQSPEKESVHVQGHVQRKCLPL